MISVIITAWNEERTVGRAVRALIDSAKELQEETEFILVCPDTETKEAASAVFSREPFTKVIYIKDPQRGKPHALNLAFKKATGTILVSTDGDVEVHKNSLLSLLLPFADNAVGGVTGRPVCSNDRNSRWGYWGHLFIDAAHHKRLQTLANGMFYPMSGYLLAVRNIGWTIPDGILDDVYFSYRIHEKGYSIAYAPEATVAVRQPTSTRDWMKQKVRSIVGYQNLSVYFPCPPKTRTFFSDLRFFLYPLIFAQNAKEYIWSVQAYPFRIYLWILVWWTTVVRGKRATDVWYRIRSTK